MTSSQRSKGQRGYILLVVYIAAVFITTVSFAFFARHRVAVLNTERYQNRILAFNASESAIDKALRELATDAALRSLADTNQTYTSDYVEMEQNGFTYRISPVTGQPMVRRIDATGYAPSFYNDDDTDKPRAAQKSEITVYCQITTPAPGLPLFQYGIYAENYIAMSGLRVTAFDSYNSNQGAYGGSNVNADGAFALNSIVADKILLKNTTVKGDVLVGDGGDPETVIDLKKAIIEGDTSTIPTDFVPPEDPVLPAGTTPVDLSNVTGIRTLDGDTVYHCSSIKVAGLGQVVTTGPVQIYVDNDVDIGGNGITVPENQPGNLIIYVLGHQQVKVAGNGSFYGGIIAPESTITTNGNGDYFGAVIAKTFNQIGNGAFHFDLAMTENPPVDPNQTNIVRVLAWQEMHSLSWGTGS
ncbi:MAG: hypothetical protein KTQ49_04145 [Candidatus Omnitrophica bacterium]|nr:hypothetical protein [Candidatus Omnitrophota bacterium]